MVAIVDTQQVGAGKVRMHFQDIVEVYQEGAMYAQETMRREELLQLGQ
jgi:hypothetical protein